MFSAVKFWHEHGCISCLEQRPADGGFTGVRFLSIIKSRLD